VVIFSQGQHFGEWGIIDNQPRKASAIAIDEVDMFLLDKKPFNISIGVTIELFRKQ
jgi:hypothetical protein